MISRIAVAAGILGAVTSAVTAGVYADFSARIMPSLGRMANPAGIARMQQLNRSIEQGPFMLAFGGAAVSGGYLIYRLLRGDRATADVLLAAGGSAYLAGLLLTMVYNVPLNKRLGAADPHATSSLELWRDYLQHWTAANTVRGVLSAAAVVLLVIGLVMGTRQRTEPPADGPSPHAGQVTGRVSR